MQRLGDTPTHAGDAVQQVAAARGDHRGCSVPGRAVHGARGLHRAWHHPRRALKSCRQRASWLSPAAILRRGLLRGVRDGPAASRRSQPRGAERHAVRGARVPLSSFDAALTRSTRGCASAARRRPSWSAACTAAPRTCSAHGRRRGRPEAAAGARRRIALAALPRGSCVGYRVDLCGARGAGSIDAARRGGAEWSNVALWLWRPARWSASSTPSWRCRAACARSLPWPRAAMPRRGPRLAAALRARPERVRVLRLCAFRPLRGRARGRAVGHARASPCSTGSRPRRARTWCRGSSPRRGTAAQPFGQLPRASAA